MGEVAHEEILFGGRVQLVAFGPPYNGDEQDWTFKHFQTPEDAYLHRETSIGRYLPEIAQAYDMPTIYAPSPIDFNARIAHVQDLSVPIRIARGRKSTLLMRGIRADGVLLRPGKTFGLSAAGCEVLIAVHEPTSTVGVAHAGRKSLINEDKLLRKEGRMYESVVESLLFAMGCLNNGESYRVKVKIAFPIDGNLLTYPWDDPKYALLNRRRSIEIRNEWGEECTPGWKNPEEQVLGKIDTNMLARRQLERLGVPQGNIETIAAPHDWYTTRSQHPDRRNLILVKCCY